MDWTWLCRVERLNRLHTPSVGGLVPVARLGEDGWTALSDGDARAALPDRGQIVWFDVPDEVDRNDLISVRVEARRNYRASGEAEAFQVAGWDWAVEVLDLRAWDLERSVRIALTQDGLDVALVTPHVLVRLDDETAAGPLTLERTSSGRWRVPDAAHEDVEVRRLVDDYVSKIPLGTASPTLVHDRSGVGRPVRLLNWTPDRTLALGLLGRIRKLTPKTAKALEVSKSVYKQYVESYPGFQFQNDRQRDQEAARFARVEEFVAVVERDEALLASAAEALLEHPAVARSLEEPIRAAVAEARLQARAEAEAAVTDVRAQADALRNERDALEAQRDDLVLARDAALLGAARAEDAVADARRDADVRVGEVEAEIASRLARAAERPAAFFAEVAVLRALTSLPSAGAAQGTPARAAPSVPAAPSVWSPNPSEPRPLDAAGADLTAAVWTAFQDLTLAPALVGTFLTGRVAVVAGSGAHAVLRAFADAFAGGRLVWIPASPMLSAPHDLLGQFDPASGRFVAHPAGLLDCFDAAAAEDGLALVVVEGYDRAPAEHYLMPLAQAYADAALLRGARTVPFVGPDGASRRLAWPANVLLACVPGEGSGALPPGAAFWRHALLVDAGNGAGQPSVDLGWTTAAAWKDASAAVAAAARSADLPFAHAPVPPSARDAARLSIAASTRLLLPPADARRRAFVGACLPHVSDADLDGVARGALGSDAEPLAERLGALSSSVRPF